MQKALCTAQMCYTEGDIDGTVVPPLLVVLEENEQDPLLSGCGMLRSDTRILVTAEPGKLTCWCTARALGVPLVSPFGSLYRAKVPPFLHSLGRVQSAYLLLLIDLCLDLYTIICGDRSFVKCRLCIFLQAHFFGVSSICSLSSYRNLLGCDIF